MFEITSAVVAIAVVYLLFSNHRQRKKLSDLEAKIRDFSVPRADEDRPEAGLRPKKVADDDAAVGGDDPGPWAAAKGGVIAPTLRAASAGKRPAGAPKPFVFKAKNWALARNWLAANWFLAIAALSLALAGVFLVQYGVENGLLSPFWRVMAAAALGGALIAGGEFVRRRWGDEAGGHTAFLPSTFAGAGLVALFAAVLSARQLYGLIGPELALGWLVAVSGVAVVLGWFYGPFLAVVGILGSVGAPFLVGGDSAAPQLFYYYFALVAVVALLVDAVKRWAWVSALGLISAFVAAWAIYNLGAAGEHFLAFGLITAVAAIALPRLSIWPSHDGAMVSLGLAARLRVFGKGKVEPVVEFPTRVAAGAFVGAAAIATLVALKDAGAGEVWLAIAVLAALFLMAAVWCRGAPALSDLAVLPPVLLIGIVAWQALERGTLFQVFAAGFNRASETAPPLVVSVLAVIGLVGSAVAHWRGLWPGMQAQAWSAGAAVLAPLMLVTLEFWWDPSKVLGAGRWAAHGIVIAAVMVFFAGQVARRDGEDKRRVAYCALAALTMISFALVVILSSAALTVALAVMVLGAAVIDRRLNLPLLGVFVQVGVIAIGWRLVIDPGIDWATRTDIWQVVLAYLGSAALMGAAWLMLGERARTNPLLTVESGIWATLGVFVSVMLSRALGGGFETHYGLSLFGSVWLVLMCVQIYRMQAGGRFMGWVRKGLAVIYAFVAIFAFALVAAFFNPLTNPGEPIVGPPVFDSLLVALGVPALVLALGVWKLPEMRRWLRLWFIALSAGLVAGYLGLEIRRLWQGPDLSQPGTADGELYTYTIALLLASVACLFFAFYRRSVPLRQIATAGIGLTIAKVFLIDMAGLAGLLRVASFLGLGLSLAGLGWIYRRMADQWDRDEAAN